MEKIIKKSITFFLIINCIYYIYVCEYFNLLFVCVSERKLRSRNSKKYACTKSYDILLCALCFFVYIFFIFWKKIIRLIYVHVREDCNNFVRGCKALRTLARLVSFFYVVHVYIKYL